MKGKRENERYLQLNAGFQRIARREKKAFLNERCKEIEENNRIAKTRDLFKKIDDSRDRHNKGQKHQGPNRSRKDLEHVARIH